MIRITLLLALGACMLGACTDFEALDALDNIEETHPEFAVPILNTSFSMQDVLEGFDENSTLLVDPDGLLRFSYRGDTTTRTSQEIFDRINNTLPPVIPLIDTIIGFPLEVDDVDLDVVAFKSGRLEYIFLNQNLSEIELTLTIPQIFRDGVPLEATHTVPAGMPFPLTSFDLAGTRFEPQNDSLYIKYAAYDALGERVTVAGFLMSPKEVDYSYAEGLIEVELFGNSIDTLDIDFYDNWVRGDVFFEDPQITISIDNTFGFPATALFTRFDIITTDSTLLPLESEFVTNGFQFGYPDFDEIGTVVETDFIFDRTNSNMPDVIGAGPIGLIYDLQAVTDADRGIRGYLTDSSTFSYHIDAEFPFWGQVRGFSVQDTTDFTIDDFTEFDEIEFKLVAENDIPLDIGLQGYFMDKAGVVLDSLFSDQQEVVVQAAAVDSDGISVKPAIKETFIKLDAERLDRILSATQLRFQAAFSTFNNGATSVKVFSDQGINVRLGAKLK